VVARGTIAEFRVQYEGADVPDPASVSWNVWGSGRANSVNTKVSWGAGYGDHTKYTTSLEVAFDEPAEALILEASYKGWTQTREILVGIPYYALYLQRGNATNISTSHIDQYPWAGKEGGTLGKDADASTYLVYKKGEKIADLRAGDATPADIIGTYHLNDDIIVAAGDWVTFFEVDALNPSRIISYGSDLAYIYAKWDGPGPYVPSAGPHFMPEITSNIRLPLTDELPEINGWFTGGVSTGKDTDKADGTSVPSGGDGNGLARAKIFAAGTKNLSGYTVTLVPEVDMFPLGDYIVNNLQKANGTGGFDYISGYDLKSTPTGFAMGANTSTNPVNGLAIIQKTGTHRYIVKHENGAWNYTTGTIIATNVSRFGIEVTQNQVAIPIVGADAAGKNILTISTGSFVKDVLPGTSAGTGKTIYHANLVSWFVDDDNYGIPSSFVPDKDLEKVKVLFNVSGGAPAGGVLTIEKDAFSVGFKPLPENGAGLGVAWSKQIYATIVSSGTLTPASGKLGGPTVGTNSDLEYTVSRTTWGFALPTYTDAPTGDKITIGWYTVEGPDWTVIPANFETGGTGVNLPTSDPIPAVSTSNGFSLDAATQFSSPDYKSSLEIYLGDDGTGKYIPGVYGKTVGVWVKPAGTGSDVKFVLEADGTKIANQFIAGTIAQ
jgi:hypothetical protein